MPCFWFGPLVQQTRISDGLPLTRKDPRTRFDHSDGIVALTLRSPNCALAVSLEDVRSGPGRDGYEDDQHIHWRVDGTAGVTEGQDRSETWLFPAL